VKLQSLAIKGVLRFDDELRLDCTSLPQGLIALVGANGEGKSTTLEAAIATLFRSFPTRPDRELFDYAHDRQAFMESVFAMDGDGQYRARVALDGVKRHADAVLELTAPDGTVTPLNDGKVTTFDQAVAEHLPSKALLMASAFVSQDKAGTFVQLDRKKRKELFAELLGLAQYEAMSQNAKAAAAAVETARGRLAAVRDVLARQTGPEVEQAIADQEIALSTDHAAAESERRRLHGEIEAIETRLATVQDQVAAYQAASQRVRSLEAQQTARQEEQARARRQSAAVRDDLGADLARIEAAAKRAHQDLDARAAKSRGTLAAELKQIDQDLQVILRSLDQRLTNNRSVLANAGEIRAAVTRLAEVEASITTGREDERRWQGERSAQETKLRAVQQAVSAARQVQRDLDRARTDAKLLETVPCGGSGPYAGCQFLTRAGAAKAQVAGLEQAAGRLPALQVEEFAITTAIDAAAEQLRLIAATLTDLETDQKALGAKARLEPAIAAAEGRIAELEKQRTETETSTEKARQKAQAREVERQRDLAAQHLAADATAKAESLAARKRADLRGTELQEQLTALAEGLARLEGELRQARQDLADTEAGSVQAQTLMGELAALRRRWDDTTAALARVATGEQDCARRRQELTERRAERADVEARVRTLEQDLLEWQLLTRALGRDGLQTLEIANAGPTVSAYTNELLSVCYGPRFSVELITQEARTDGKGMKEAFTIRVYDNERGGDPRDLSDLSGGEKVVVSEALANAIALTVNARSRRPIRTCWRDETTGALDPDTAPRYIAMLRKVQEIGGFERVYFVSHNLDVAALADAQLQFAGGQVHVALPPYGKVSHAA